jgi:two-component system, NarL family, nitrate/nitrite response regulator NarL
MRLLLVDDHRLFSDGLTALLRELQPKVAITSAHTVAQAEAAEGVFDLLLLDLHLPDVAGYDGITRLKIAHEATPIVVVSGEESSTHVRECINHGAMGYVPKSSSTADLLTALKRILSGQTYLPSHVMRGADTAVTPRTLPGKDETAPDLQKIYQLTKRQHDVLLKVVQGKTNKIIARELCISDATVKSHVAAVLEALDVHNRAEAVYKVASITIGVS